jgi:predicted nucleotidyltransferase
VRLTASQIEAIRETVRRLLGNGAKVWLFGSRADPSAKGGDIDLLVETETPLANRAAAAARLAGELQLALGDQKIDLIVVDPHTPARPICRIARETGVLL